MLYENAQSVVKTDFVTDCTLAKEMSELSSVTYLNDVQLSDRLLSGNISAAIIFAYSDMGWQLPYVCSSPAARLFLFQTFGHRFSDGGGVEAMLRADVSDVIVYGHSNCYFARLPACAGQHNAQAKTLVSKYFEFEHASQKKYYAENLESEDQALGLKLGRRNVLNEIKTMFLYPAIVGRASKGQLRFHAWLYDSENRILEIFDPKTKAFISSQAKVN